MTTPPVIILPACMPRSRGQTLAFVDQVNPEKNPALQRRDVTGDGVPETFCNLFVRLLLALFGIVLPELLANDLAEWFPKQADWRKVTPKEAGERAELGFPTIGVWKNSKGHGHIIAVVPAIGGTGLHSAQAGAKNWSNAPVESAGLPASAYAYFTHE